MFLLPFHVLGFSHETSPADRIGRLRLSGERVVEALDALRARGTPAVLLSTCHRTELYWWGDDDLTEWFLTTVRYDANAPLRLERADADLAVRHLFAVAAGMKSARFGEPEILGQVRRAWVAARDARVVFGELDGTFRQAIDAARHIRAVMGKDADPSLGERVREQLAARLRETSAKVPDAYVPDAHVAEARVLIIGSGDAARGVLEALRQQPAVPVQLAVTSRTDARAAAVGAAYGISVVPWCDRNAAMARADVVVFAVHVTTPLVSAEMAMAARAGASQALWIDLGVPGAVASEFRSPSVQVLSLAALDTPRDISAVNGDRTDSRAFHEARLRRATAALQQELARYARAAHRQQLGARIGLLEEQAVAVATSHGDAPVDEVVRRVTRLVLRELTRA